MQSTTQHSEAGVQKRTVLSAEGDTPGNPTGAGNDDGGAAANKVTGDDRGKGDSDRKGDGGGGGGGGGGGNKVM